VLERPHFDIASFDLPSEWALLLATDGLTEGRAAPDSGERFGVERLARAIEALGPPADLDAHGLDHVIDLVRMPHGPEFADDIAGLPVSNAPARGLDGR